MTKLELGHEGAICRHVAMEKFVAAGCGNQQAGDPRYPDLHFASIAQRHLNPWHTSPGRKDKRTKGQKAGRLAATGL